MSKSKIPKPPTKRIAQLLGVPYGQAKAAAQAIAKALREG